MTDLPITNDDERTWTAEPAADDTDAIDERVLVDAAEADAIDQRREVPIDDPDEDR
jgi:hypothetical protein